MNLVFHFRVKGLPADGRLFVAPILDVGVNPDNPVTAKRTPDVSAAGAAAIADNSANQSDTVKWTYDGGNAPGIIAFIQPVHLDAAPKKSSFIDFSTLWIKPQFPTADWRSQLESQVAEALDGTRVLLDFATTIAAGSMKGILAPVIASLRDRANTGVFRAPDGRSLALDLIQRCQAIIGDSSDPSKLIAALLAYEKTIVLNTWQKIIATRPEAPAWVGGDLTSLDADLKVRDVEPLRNLLADDRVLAPLIYLQWKQAADAAGAGSDAGVLWFKISGILQGQVLPATQLRKRLALASIGNLNDPTQPLDPLRTAAQDPHEIWRAVTLFPAGSDELTSLKANLVTALQNYLQRRFAAHPGPPFDLLFPQDASLTADAAALATQAKTFAENYFDTHINPPKTSDSADAGNAPAMATSAPPGLTIQVDTLCGVDDSADFQRLMSGIGVLMRRANKPWRCLNVAALYAVDPAKPRIGSNWDAGAVPVFTGGNVAPYRLNYHNGVRQAFVTYDAHPLVAQSPATYLAGGLQLADNGTGDPQPPVFLYKTDFTGTVDAPVVFNDWARLPGLYYSADDDNQFLPFAVTNSGAIPAELAVAETDTTLAVPYRIREQKDFVASSTLPVVSTGYKRRVQPGALRLRDAAGKPLMKDSTFPPLPSGIFPKYHDVVAAEDSGAPLLFLYSDDADATKGAYKFSVLRPATDLNNWDRWVGLDPNLSPADRSKVWADFHDNAPQAPQPKPTALGTPDQIGKLALDDPAIGGFSVSLTPLSSASGQPLGPMDVRFNRSSPSSAPAIPIACSIAGDGKASLDTAGATAVTVKIPPNEVWNLVLTPSVDAPDRFEKGILPAAGAAPLNVFELVIEAAGTALPSPQAVWDALAAGVPDAARKISVTLQPRNFNAGDAWSNVKQIDVLRQAWRWSGRPFNRRFQFDDRATLDPRPDLPEPPVLLWEAEAFGDRQDDDHLAVPTQVKLTETADVTKPIPLYTEDATRDTRAQFFRYGLRVHSRYEAILRSDQGFVESSTLLPADPAAPPNTPASFTKWKRQWVSNGWTGEVPKPQVKIIVPLTSAEPGDTTPGLLCILNEPWYGIGGLAERLEARIMQAQDPSISSGATNGPPEFGGDVILSGDPGAAISAPLPDNLQLDAGQPIGFSFDTDTPAPLIVNSSFTIRPPTTAAADAAWCFAKLQFRRVLAETAAVPAPAGSNASSWTDPVWVQFLPDFSRFASSTDAVNVKDLRMGQLSGLTFPLMKNGMVVEFKPAATFELWCVLTRMVADVFSGSAAPTQESFVDIAKYDPAQKTFTLSRDPGGSGFRLRLIEVQRREAGTGNLLDDLFPDPDPKKPYGVDTPARIVRVSPPFGI
jgi:hypothetical protein